MTIHELQRVAASEAQGLVSALGSGRAGNCGPSGGFDANQKDHS